MPTYFSYIRANVWKLLIAFFLARTGARIMTAFLSFTQLVQDVLILAAISLALQGLFFALLFTLLKKLPVDPLFCLMATVVSVVLGYALLWVILSGLADPRVALLALPLGFAALSALAMRVRTPPPPPTPW